MVNPGPSDSRPRNFDNQNENGRQVEINFLVLFKDKEQYILTYEKGKELDLFATLLDYANDDRYNLDMNEVLNIIDELNTIYMEEFEKNNPPGGSQKAP